MTAGFCTPSLASASPDPEASGSGAEPLFGTLDTQTATPDTEKKSGISVAEFDLSWASFEPKPGVINMAYIESVRPYFQAFRKAGMRITLGLGFSSTPAWLLSLPDGRYVNQFGQSADEPDLIFSQVVRGAAATYLAQVARYFPLSDFWAIRLTSGDVEMLYPPNGTYWAFNHAALTGDDLPPTMTPNPFPNWRPGNPGLDLSQINQWVNWYIRGLDDVTDWQMGILGTLGFNGYYQLVTPGSGTRPDELTEQERANLPDGVTGVGAVWNRYYSMLSDKTKVVAYISSVADDSGNNDPCQAGDDALPVTSPAMDSWSATRWISRIAAADNLLVAGENPGYGMPTTLNSPYLKMTSTGMMAKAIRQATSCKFQVFYWAHDVNLWNGTIPFSLYARDIASVGTA